MGFARQSVAGWGKEAMIWRAMTSSDLPVVKAIADRVHSAYPEEIDVFAERLLLYPAGCFVLSAGDGTLHGYIVSHPVRFGQPPRLNTLLGDIPCDADSYYIHDLALLPEARGEGAASRIVVQLAAIASGAGFATLSLVAVNGSAGFWGRHGFAPATTTELAAKLGSYGADALFMARKLRD